MEDCYVPPVASLLCTCGSRHLSFNPCVSRPEDQDPHYVMGHATESTVYIKGPRERHEMSFGGHGGAVTIMQCDQKRMISISGNQCTVVQTGGGETSCPAMPNMRAMGRENPEAEPTPPRKGGVVT